MARKLEAAAGPAGRRPMPPTILFDASHWHTRFVPADGVGDWIEKAFMTPESPLFNDDHKHLRHADIAYLWATVENRRQMRRVIGQCEEVTFRCGAWQKGRQEQQMEEWFGRVPAYLITLDAVYVNECSDLEWCALVEHELYHIAHRQDEFGAPAFTKDGLPKLGIRGHDVNEFVGVVERYGVGSPDSAIAKMVRAANAGPKISHISIAQACGTCLLKAA
ncbi:putative metallopeptidase [Robbsia andropogonis]|uniref:putative metallopeptidase n=1 Tax=Robbsia andropogonis TaxID=28092 RepID=UPI0020A05569|nr:putative metallopeptidase [Robbsia andropogonis]MCP1120096.1 hypothetical protein [Robbsia andropogonis]MCP1130072.1 hypothetical protein [Robbsia andropogonis]